MKVSFICASYNYKDYISETIESVIAQDNSDWELIVFDDGSTDGSCELIEQYTKNDSRVKLYTHANNSNKGLITTLKEAAKVANGEWLAFIESDDILKPDYLSQKLNALEKFPDTDLIFSGVEILGTETLKKNYAEIFKNRDSLIKENFNIVHLIRENVIPTFSCVMIRKDLFANKLDFNSPIAQNIDWWLWAQVFAEYKTLYLNKNLSIWRRHEGSYISSVQLSKMPHFIRSLFKIIFKSKIKILPRILLEIHMFFNTYEVTKIFGTPSRKIRNLALNALYRMNNIKPDLIYYNN